MTTIKRGERKQRGENPNNSSNWSRCHQSDVAHEIRQHFVGNAAMSEVASHQIPRWSPKCPYEARTPSRFSPKPVKNIRKGIWTRWARCVKKLSQTKGRHHEYITDLGHPLVPCCLFQCSNKNLSITEKCQNYLTFVFLGYCCCCCCRFFVVVAAAAAAAWPSRNVCTNGRFVF